MKGTERKSDGTEDVRSTETPSPGAVRTVKVRAPKRSMWEDRRVRFLGGALGVLVVFYLLTVASALVFGFIGNKAPRTIAERSVVAWEAAATTDTATLDQVQSYALALIEAGQYSKAQAVIDTAETNETFDLTRGQNLLYCQAELYRAQGDQEKAIETFTEVMDLTLEAYEKEYDEGPELQNWAVAFGIHENYFFSAAARAFLHMEREEWDQALEMLDTFLADNPRDSAMLVSRGDVKAEMGDTAGAEADYREAMRYIPDMPEALEGLEKIGAGE